jgi:hypothetical protein
MQPARFEVTMMFTSEREPASAAETGTATAETGVGLPAEKAVFSSWCAAPEGEVCELGGFHIDLVIGVILHLAGKEPLASHHRSVYLIIAHTGLASNGRIFRTRNGTTSGTDLNM